MPAPRIACLISDHGYGHATRCSAVINPIIATGAQVLIVSGVPKPYEWTNCSIDCARFYESTIAGPFDYFQCKLDVGIISICWHTDVNSKGVTQVTSVQVDVLGTLRDLETLWAGMEEKLDLLVRFLAEVHLLVFALL